MKLKERIGRIAEKAKQKNIVLLISLFYSFCWAICKIVFGAFTMSYFFCISGASSLLFGFVKKIYLKNNQSDDFDVKKGKSITISILLIISSCLFVFYMARLFFVNEIKEFGLIMSITIATCSFFELGVSIYQYVKAKKSNDILLQSFKGCSLASACFAIVLTQVALLGATGSTNNFYNAITGVIGGGCAIIIGIIVLIRLLKIKENKSERN